MIGIKYLLFWCFFVLLMMIIQINGEEKVIDHVGEPDYPQPQDPPSIRSRIRSDNVQSAIDARQLNIIDDNEDDLQQRQQPIAPIFGKGTYLEFVSQEKQNN